MNNETDQTPAGLAVYRAINAVQAAMSKEGISKDNRNQQQGYAFRGIDDCYAALAPHLAAQKLCIIPRYQKREVVEHQSKSGGALFYVTIEGEFDFVSAEDGSRHTARMFGEAMDSADKATNKAASAAFKYLLLQTFCIPTEGDNDADSATPEPAGRVRGSSTPTQAPKAAPTPQGDTRPAAKTSDVVPQMEADKDQRFRFLAALSDYRTSAMMYFAKKGWIKDTDRLEDMPNKYVPTTKHQYDSIMAELKAFMDGDGVTDEQWWKKVAIPFGNQEGTTIGDLEKKKLYGWCMNYEVEETYGGIRKSDADIEKMKKFREALDAAAAHYEFK